MAKSKDREPGMRDLIGAVVRIADAFDRLVTLMEDVAEVVELPHFEKEEGDAGGDQ